MKNHRNKLTALAIAGAVVFSVGTVCAEMQYIDLGGPASGYLAVANFKNGVSQNDIEGKDAEGNPNPNHNGLPDYPNYQIPTGQTNAGRWTAIIVSPQFSGADYSALYGNAAGVTVNNQGVTDANYATMSAGLIGFDKSLLTGAGTEVIGVSNLTFNFDTYLWDGYTGGDKGPYQVTGTPTYISPFSTAQTAYNDANGAGNAAIVYNISLENVSGVGLTFEDGVLVDMDIAGDLSVLLRVGYFFVEPDDPFIGMASATFTGTFSADGLGYEFAVDDTQSAAIFSDVHMVMNREGTVSVVPEPSTYATLGGLVLAGAVWVRRKKARD
mgnify:CR=1 FL=1